MLEVLVLGQSELEKLLQLHAHDYAALPKSFPLKVNITQSPPGVAGQVFWYV